MNENLYRLFDDVLISSFNIKCEGNKTVLEVGDGAKYGNLELYSIFPGIILSYIDLNIENINDVFVEEKINHRLLEIMLWGICLNVGTLCRNALNQSGI